MIYVYYSEIACNLDYSMGIKYVYSKMCTSINSPQLFNELEMIKTLFIKSWTAAASFYGIA